MASAWIRHCDARYIGAYADTLVNINNSVNNCNFILGLQVALKTFVSSAIPINFFSMEP